MRLPPCVPALGCASGFLPTSIHTCGRLPGSSRARCRRPGPLKDDPNLALGHLPGVLAHTLGRAHCLDEHSLFALGMWRWVYARPCMDFFSSTPFRRSSFAVNSARTSIDAAAAAAYFYPGSSAPVHINLSPFNSTSRRAIFRRDRPHSVVLSGWGQSTNCFRVSMEGTQHGGNPDAAASWSLPLEFYPHTPAAVKFYSIRLDQGNPLR